MVEAPSVYTSPPMTQRADRAEHSFPANGMGIAIPQHNASAWRHDRTMIENARSDRKKRMWTSSLSVRGLRASILLTG